MLFQHIFPFKTTHILSFFIKKYYSSPNIFIDHQKSLVFWIYFDFPDTLNKQINKSKKSKTLNKIGLSWATIQHHAETKFLSNHRHFLS